MGRSCYVLREARNPADPESKGTILIENHPKLGHFVTVNQEKAEFEIENDIKRCGKIWLRKR